MIITRSWAEVSLLRGLARRPSPERVGEGAGAGGARHPPPTGSEILDASVLLAMRGDPSLEVLEAYRAGGADATPHSGGGCLARSSRPPVPSYCTFGAAQAMPARLLNYELWFFCSTCNMTQRHNSTSHMSCCVLMPNRKRKAATSMALL
eukprot:4220816-Pleurochrysis_carterae.AAC.1